jgi:hypothetical protein
MSVFKYIRQIATCFNRELARSTVERKLGLHFKSGEGKVSGAGGRTNLFLSPKNRDMIR